MHQKGDYSVNPALCHSRVCISTSTNINVVMYEEPVSVCVANPLLFINIKCVLCRKTASMPAKKNHNLWHKCHHDTFTVVTAAVGALFHHLCGMPCVCSGLQQHQLQREPLIERVCSGYGYHVSAFSATSHFLQMP